jgi:pimeloyl-ACP methyl ester carboxylesterase
MPGRMVATNGVELWVEIDGDASAPAVLLLGGSDASALRWPPELVAALVAGGRHVVRLEHRDSGASTKIDPDAPYRLDDLAQDVVGALHALGIGEADVVGYSMGGVVAQLLALDHPACVRSLVLVATTPGADDDLPPADDRFADVMAQRLFAPLPSSNGDRVAWVVDLYRLLAGDRYPFDEEGQRSVAAAEVERSWYPESGHGVAATSARSRRSRLATIAVPTLVVHGTRDPVYPVAHAEALAAGIPGAELLVVEGLGHEVPAAFAGELAAAVLGHVER